jgi:hypothetical protein
LSVDKATLHIGAIAFIHRFGSSLDGHVHFHVCVIDGVFGAVVEGHWTSRNLPFVTDSLRCTTDDHINRYLPFSFTTCLS